MHDIAVAAVGILSGGHYYEISFSRIYHLNVVNGEAIVEGHRYDCLHRSLVKEVPDFDVCYLHNLKFPSCVVDFLSILNIMVRGKQRMILSKKPILAFYGIIIH